MQPVVFGPLFNRQSQINNRQSYIVWEATAGGWGPLATGIKRALLEEVEDYRIFGKAWNPCKLRNAF